MVLKLKTDVICMVNPVKELNMGNTKVHNNNASMKADIVIANDSNRN
jgi:hypothetical protein